MLAATAVPVGTWNWYCCGVDGERRPTLICTGKAANPGGGVAGPIPRISGLSFAFSASRAERSGSGTVPGFGGKAFISREPECGGVGGLGQSWIFGGKGLLRMLVVALSGGRWRQGAVSGQAGGLARARPARSAASMRTEPWTEMPPPCCHCAIAPASSSGSRPRRTNTCNSRRRTCACPGRWHWPRARSRQRR